MSGTGLYKSIVSPSWQAGDDGESISFWTTLAQNFDPLSQYQPLMQACQNMSGASLVQSQLTIVAPISGVATETVWNNIRDRVVFRIGSQNVDINLSIPCPRADIFWEGTNRVDLSNIWVQAWWAEVKAVLADQGGYPWLYLRWGQRRRQGR